jgi:arginyl-tRNA synthetase
MEDGEPDAIALWKTLRDISIEYHVEACARLNIKFDEYSGESQVSLNPEAVAEVESILKCKGIYEEQDGAWVIDYDKHGAKLGTPTVRGWNGLHDVPAKILRRCLIGSKPTRSTRYFT